MVYRTVLPVLLFLLIFVDSVPGQSSQWRGPKRNGIYPERGLQKSWTEKGPEMLWSFEELGAGHGSPGFSKDKIFILGMPDSTGVLYAFNYGGKLLWKRQYGPEWHQNYTGPRSTPSIAGELVYFESGMGIVYCYNGNTGELKWSVDLLKKFDAKNITWGMAESLLIEGDKIFCTPGGVQNNIVSLNRYTGETIWTSPGNKEPAAYCSPILVKHNKSSLIVTMTAESIICVDAETGQYYWQVPQFQGNKIHANTPVYVDGIIYCSSADTKPNSGLAALKLSDDGKTVSTIWRNEKFANLMGGIIVSGGYIYGSVYRKNVWCCIKASSGELIYSADKLNDGNIIQAEGLYYCSTEKGEIALVNATPDSFNVISRFAVPLGSDQYWSHPVIYGGKLYVRHGNALMAFNVKNR